MSSIFTIVLPPLTVAYGVVTRLRLAAYEKGLLKTERLKVPVISVGNLTTGGTGKTPLVEWVCRVLAREGRKVSVLTRGYGRTDESQRVVVSDAVNVLGTTPQSGDEPQLLAESLKGIASVVCDSDRVSAGTWAIEHLGADVFVLDDGFQHLRLARDLNILVIDASNPWGGGHLLPYGRMREPRHGLSRADCVVITRTYQDSDLAALKNEIQRFTAAPIFTSRMQSKRIRKIDSTFAEQLDSIPQPLAAFCAVGNPRSFFDHLKREGFDLACTQTFPDHHNYSQADIDRFIEEARAFGARGLITTAKDAVKIRDFAFEFPCNVLEIEIVIDQHGALLDLIRNSVVEH